MAEAKVESFRVHSDLEPDLQMLLDWCAQNNSSFNSVINSFLPAITYSVQFQAFIDDETKNRYVRADFGVVRLRDLHERRVCQKEVS